MSALSIMQPWFLWDALSSIMLMLVVSIGACVAWFARDHLRGDRRYGAFFAQLSMLLLAVGVMVTANHLALFWAGWCASNLLLMRLMMHKTGWRAAKAAGLLTGAYQAMGAVALAVAFLILHQMMGVSTVEAVLQQSVTPPLLPALCLILLAALVQSAIWPFHRWLTSSLNSPTVVSAMMHAGLVNGGGFLLVRFAPLYLQVPTLLHAVFLLGVISALLGTVWKLMQSDVKRMLACSTMGQMGFMMAQCGLGLFPAAVAHLVWHGMFKAYLFLASGGVAQERRLDLGYPPAGTVFVASLLCGALASLGFAQASGKSWLAGDTTMVLLLIALLGGAQLAMPLLRDKPFSRLPLAMLVTAIAGLAYGGSVWLIGWWMEPMQRMQPLPLNGLHVLGMALLVLAWVGFLFLRPGADKRAGTSPALLRTYVAMLNASQPHPATVTTHRNHYRV